MDLEIQIEDWGYSDDFSKVSLKRAVDGEKESMQVRELK
jgi:hypothetical protein